MNGRVALNHWVSKRFGRQHGQHQNTLKVAVGSWSLHIRQIVRVNYMILYYQKVPQSYYIDSKTQDSGLSLEPSFLKISVRI